MNPYRLFHPARAALAPCDNFCRSASDRVRAYDAQAKEMVLATTTAGAMLDGRAQAAEMAAEARAYDARALEMVADVHNLIVTWTGRFEPALLKRPSAAGAGPYTFISATHDGVNWVEFYIDRHGSSDQSEALSPMAFGCAVELGLEVSFSAALQPRAPPPSRQGQHLSRPRAHLSGHQKAALSMAVDAAHRALFVPDRSP